MVYFFIGVGGIIGSILRFLLTNQLGFNLLGSIDFPAVTLFINLFGTFMLGFFMIIFQKIQVYPAVRQGITVGIIGSFTTFSAFTVECMELLNKGQLAYAFLYIFLSTIGGLFFAWFGMKFGRSVLRSRGKGGQGQ